jgi:SpoVK/Ycf46/Vps4 family AAA+-type ATPase
MHGASCLRRLARRIFIPLPDSESRRSLIQHLLQKQFAGRPPVLSPAQFEQIVRATDGYSGSDLTTLCQEAALGPIRELGPAALRSIKAEDIRPLSLQDFLNAVQTIRPSVSQDKLAAFQKWVDNYGVSR